MGPYVIVSFMLIFTFPARHEMRCKYTFYVNCNWVPTKMMLTLLINNNGKDPQITLTSILFLLRVLYYILELRSVHVTLQTEKNNFEVIFSLFVQLHLLF